MTAPTLTEFLLARIAEDAERAPTRHTLLCLRMGCETCIFDDDEDAIAAERVCTCRYPARVLAECDAKRRIVDIYAADIPDEWRGLPSRPMRALASLAALYSDHPDYDEAWRA